MSANKETRWPWGAILAIVGTIGILGIVSMAQSSSTNQSELDAPVFAVRRGPLTISVVESGTIQAREQKIIKNEVEGQSTIIYLIPEGNLVEKGELLVELEGSRLQDDLVEQQIRVQNAEAAFIRARENLEVAKNQATSDISRADLDFTFAQQDRQQYRDGEYPKELKEADSRITLAHEELERAKEKSKWSQRLFEEKYISQTELDADRLTFNRADLDHKLAVASKELLEDYTNKREMAQLKSDVDQAQLALERVRLKSNADIVQADADLKAKEAEFGQQKAKLEKVNRQIANTKIYAPRAGLVVYATSAKAGWHGNDDPLDEGQSVRERQELIYLPTADEMNAEIQIHESNLDNIRVGMPVRVTVDALKGRQFTGRVSHVAPLPNAYQMRLNPDLKVYVTQIQLDGKQRDLRTGMSCQAEIIIDRHEDAVYAPVQAIVREGKQHVAYVRSGSAIERTPIEIGLDNNRMVHVLSGLAAGQSVLLTPPLAMEVDSLEEEPAASTKETVTKKAAAAPAVKTKPSMPGPSAEGAASEDHSRKHDGGSEKDPGQADRPARRGFGEMSSEERQRMRKRFENMTPEQREKMRKQFQQQGGRRGRGEGGGRNRSEGGRRGGSRRDGNP